jgi:class 3 adenylate cyclase
MPLVVPFSAIRYFLVAFVCLQSVVAVFMVGSALYFQRCAKLPNWAAYIYVFYVSTFGYILQSIAANYAGRLMCALIWRPDVREIGTDTVLLVFAVLLGGAHVWFMIDIVSQTLYFQTNSLQSLIATPGNMIAGITILANFLSSFAADAPKWVGLTGLSVGVFLYVGGSFSVFYCGGFVKKSIQAIVLAASVVAIAFCLLHLVTLACSASEPLYYQLIWCFLGFISYHICHHVLNKRTAQALFLLQRIEDDNALFNDVTSPNHFVFLACAGFANAVQVVLDWSVFKLAIERWPRSSIVWYSYAKFVAVYPSETPTLSWIYNAIVLHRLKGTGISTIIAGALTIIQQRDANLSEHLHRELMRLTKQQQPTKHKLRHVWDVVIQGNVGEVESATKRAVFAIERNDTDYQHLYRQFPNNRYVARAYASFLRELTAEPEQVERMNEKANFLVSGHQVNSDWAHDLGVSTFPMIPDRLDSKMVHQQATMECPDSPKDSEDGTAREDGLQEKLVIRDRIEGLSVPAVVGHRLIILGIMVVWIAGPVVAILIWATAFIAEIQEPVDSVRLMSELRCYTYQIPAFSLRYLGEFYGIFTPLSRADRPPASFGGAWETDLQLKSIMGKGVGSIQETSTLYSLRRATWLVMEAQDLFFRASFEYRYYDSPDNVTILQTTLRSSLTTFILQDEPLILRREFGKGIINSSTVLNQVGNSRELEIAVRTISDLLITDLLDIYPRVVNLGWIVLPCCLVFIVISAIIVMVVSIRWIRRDKQTTYHCLASLPKSAVSRLADNLKFLKKEQETDPEVPYHMELTKREETVLKILSAGSGSSETTFSDLTCIIVGYMVMMIAHCVIVSLFFLLLLSESSIIRESVPHLDAILSAYIYDLAAVCDLQRLYFSGTDMRVHYSNPNQTFMDLQEALTRGRDAYYRAGYGGNATWEHMFDGWHQGIEYARSRLDCPAGLKVVRSANDSYYCFPPDMAYASLEALILSQVDDADELILGQIWRTMLTPLYDLFFRPMFESIIPKIKDRAASERSKYVILILVLTLFCILVGIMIMVHIGQIGGHIRSVLRLLLHCKTTDVLATQEIMHLLSGNFSNRESDNNYDEDFFELVFMRLPDAIFAVNGEFVIQQANHSCTRLFFDDSLKGKNLYTFFSSGRFVGDYERLFQDVGKSPTETLIFKRPDNQESHISVNIFDTGTGFIVSCRDVTQTDRWNQLIAQERQRSDDLLKTILPESLVPRVQNEEKDISFSVPLATILFLDIVNFTPWCGRLPAQTVMATLNEMFKRFDQILARKKTMTKIKCIGDCYMAAGGIFSHEPPAVHASEVVMFGLESITEMGVLNEEKGEQLEIRVGVNTGGPIVAGVLGIGKPTFEILGPAINMAQQMEHNGRPMLVHVSEGTYGHICTGPFVFFVFGAVVRGHTVRTFIVHAKKQDNL